MLHQRQQIHEQTSLIELFDLISSSAAVIKMPVPPFEAGPRGMTRRHYLVETNRLRVSQHAPLKQQLEEEDLRIATRRADEKKEQQMEWTQSRKTAAIAAATAASAANRPLPGGAPHSTRMGGTKREATVNAYKQEKEEEALKKQEYNRIYEAEAKLQLAERQATLDKMRNDERAQMAALRTVNEEHDRRIALAEEQAKEEQRQYLERTHKSNMRELEAKRAEQRAREARDRSLQALVDENNRHRAEMDERRQKNVTRMLQIQNEESHREAARNKSLSAKKESDEHKAVLEHNRRLAQEEQEAEQQKRERFRQEFEDCVARDKEFRRTHNYDETPEVARQRNELVAQSYRLVCQEENLRRAERQKEYKEDLIKQMTDKQEFRMTHLDEPGM